MKGHFLVSRYSDELITEITEYLEEKDGQDTSREQAELYLDSLADLYECLKESIRQGFPVKKGGQPPKAATASALKT